MQKFQPLEDRILVKKKISTELETTEAGIIIPDIAKKEVFEGTVVSVGQGKYAQDTGVFMPTFLSKGDVVLFGASQGLPISVDGENGKEEVLILRESDVLLVISKKEVS